MKLVSITFVIVYIGLLILGTGNSLSVALICAVFDVLPLLGVPVILIPWITYLFIVGNTGLAIGLIVLLAVVVISRQLLEPKITGNSIGVSSAFLMLSFMMISLSIFGVAGLILAPILLILIKELLTQGYLKQWIRLPSEEFDVSPWDMSVLTQSRKPIQLKPRNRKPDRICRLPDCCCSGSDSQPIQPRHNVASPLGRTRQTTGCFGHGLSLGRTGFTCKSPYAIFNELPVPSSTTSFIHLSRMEEVSGKYLFQMFVPVKDPYLAAIVR